MSERRSTDEVQCFTLDELRYDRSRVINAAKEDRGRLSSTSKDSDGSASGSHKDRSPTTDRTCAKQFARWLAHGFTGCGFAQSFANSKSRALFVATDGVTSPEQVDVLFDAAAAESQPAFLVFPAIREESALVDQLQRLRSGQRWTVSTETVKGLTTSDLLVGLRWTTRTGMRSMPMGFGPFPTMPVTRRAPYVCIATWPGGHENPFTHRRPTVTGSVDFLDSALPRDIDKDEFDRTWNGSVERTGELLAETHDSPRFYRTVAFRLSAQAASAF